MSKILIIYPSWEERSYLGFNDYINNIPIDIVYSIEKEGSLNPKETNASLFHINEICNQKKINILRVGINDDTKNAFFILETFTKSLNQNDEIFLDITTMSRNIIWSLLFFLKEFFQKINIIYYPPKSYSSDWISREPSKPRLLFKHSGIINLELKNCLIIITGFDVDRTKQLVRYYDPQKIVLLIQCGRKFDNSVRNSSACHKKVCEELGYTNIDIYDIDSYSSDQGYPTIKATIEKYNNDYNIIFASLGPKTSAISLYKAFIKYPEIALSYVPCKEYNIDYCEGIDNVFSFEFSLDNI